MREKGAGNQGGKEHARRELKGGTMDIEAAKRRHQHFNFLVL
ncbi:hypothetical protein A2U01_0088814, partial [Trifolium medium]|nr:hypothetical protein [Trifolium medium]